MLSAARTTRRAVSALTGMRRFKTRSTVATLTPEALARSAIVGRLTIGELHQIPSILQAIARCNLIETFITRLARRWPGTILRFDAPWSGRCNTGERPVNVRATPRDYSLVGRDGERALENGLAAARWY